MPVGLIRYRGERDRHVAGLRYDLACLLAPVAPKLFAEVFNDCKLLDDPELRPEGQEWDIASTDICAFNVDDLTITITMGSGPGGRTEERRDELKMAMAIKVLDFIEAQRPDLRRHIKTLQVDIRFQPMSGIVVDVSERSVTADWGNTPGPSLKGTSLRPAF